ncbi:MAG: OmpL47-type beta-barrel domain-containing protein [Promethearchaeota archaeon]
MTKIECKFRVTGSMLLFLLMFSSFSQFFFPQVNNKYLKGESVKNLDELKLSTTYWTTTEVISTESTLSSQYPEIAIDGNGNVHVVWEDYTDLDGQGTDYELDIFYKRWDAISSIWTTTEVVSTESTNQSRAPTLTVDGAGNVHVVWRDSTNYDGSGTDYDIFYKRWNAISSTWTTTEVVSTESTGQSGEPTVTVDSAGNVHVAWYSNDIYYKRRDAISSTWTTTELVSTESTGGSWYPSIAVDGNGNVHLVWYGDENYSGSGTDNDIFYKRWNATSNTWTTAEIISTESTGESTLPTIAVDGSGNVHVAWNDDTMDSDSSWDIYYKRWVAINNTWTMTEVVSTEQWRNCNYPTIAVDGSENVHVAWRCFSDYGDSGFDYDIYYKRWDAISSIWTTTEVVSTESTGDSGPSSIAVNGDISVHVVWYESTNYTGSGTDSDIFYKRMNPIPEIKIHTPNQNAFFGSIAPNFNISVTLSILDTMWYTLDDGLINKTFTGLTGTINQTEWDKKGHEVITIRFYANDSFGRVGYSEVVLNKDLNPPISSLYFIPYRGKNNVTRSTRFNLTADDGLGSGVSVIRYKINSSAWIDYTGLFDLSNYDYGYYFISYQAIDLVNNIEPENTLLVKLVKLPSEQFIPGYNMFLLISIICVVSVFLVKKR